MLTSVKIETKLLDEAIAFGKYKSKKELTEEALRTYIMIHKQARIKAYRGSLKWNGNLEEMRENSDVIS